MRTCFKRELTASDVAAIRAEREAGASFRAISVKWTIGDHRAMEVCLGVVPRSATRGRKTEFLPEDVEMMRLQRAEGIPIMDLVRIWRTSAPRIHQLVGDVKPDKNEGGRPAPVALDTMAFRAAGVPDTPANREACRGHSRAWMRLFRLRVLHPDSCDGADAANCCHIINRNGTNIYC